MNASVTYDLSRLLLRSLGTGPNGIDRVDLNLGRYFLGSECQQNCGILLNRLGPAVIGNRGAAALLDLVDKAWRENLDLADDQTYHALRQSLLGPPYQQTQVGYSSKRIVGPSPSRVTSALRIASILLPQLAILRRVPKGSIFIHTTQFPFFHLFRWLERRPDVKPVFFIHDLLPIRFREFFTVENANWHQRFLEIFVRYGRAAIVNSEVVKNDVIAFLKTRACNNKQILVAPMPAASIFVRATPVDVELRARPYFVICGTIEPRKNHLLLLKVWQELVRSEGSKAPKLVIIGRRGWNNEEVFDRLDRAPWVSSHVIEVAGLTSNAMRQVVANARALLMPSFAEGYGFPIVEALAIGTPVIASDIAVFREIGGGRINYCKPNDTTSWLKAVRTHAVSEWRNSESATTEAENQTTWESYSRSIAAFVGGL
jgi:glycosyltransferase involved in cell wall biosynthesis